MLKPIFKNCEIFANFRTNHFKIKVQRLTVDESVGYETIVNETTELGNELVNFWN